MGDHDSKNCSNSLQCPRCGDAHPVTYRGCPEYLRKEANLLERINKAKDKAKRKSQPNTPQPDSSKPATNPWFTKPKKQPNKNEQN